MRIYPAIDIRTGNATIQGRFDKVTIYNDNPVEVAKEWFNAGLLLFIW